MSAAKAKETKTMSTQKTTPRLARVHLAILGSLLLLGVWLIPASAASAAGPAWSLSLNAIGSFVPNVNGNPVSGPGYRLVAENVGGEPTSGTYKITDTLPTELSPGAEISGEDEQGNALSCASVGQTVTCTGTEALESRAKPGDPGEKVEVIIPVHVAPNTSGRSLHNEAKIEGGGAAPVSAAIDTAIGTPTWELTARSLPTNLTPGPGGGIFPTYYLVATNAGGTPTSGAISVTDTLPEGLTPTSAVIDSDEPGTPPSTCPIAGQTVSCTSSESIRPGRHLTISIGVDVDHLVSGTVLNEASIEGGGAAPAFTATTTTISPTPASYGFFGGAAGFSAPLTDADGGAVTQAGSHPYQLTVNLGFTTELPGVNLVGAGRPRDAMVDLPRGEIVNPTATPVLCTEAQLITEVDPSCPAASQIGTATVTTIVGGPIALTSALYNMVPPPGTASSFGFDAVGVGVFVHIIGSVRSDGDYGLTGSSTNLLALSTNPVFGTRVELWGDPSSPSHDGVRGNCLYSSESCSISVEPSDTALLTAPSECTGQPSITNGRTRNWEEPTVFHKASYESADLQGTPVAVGGCNQLAFEPTLEAKPTTNLADSPSGLDVKVHQPQNQDVGGLSPAIMRDIRLILPEGMSVNPSSADGLSSCAEAQSGVHTRNPSNCPDGSKLGTVEATTPLLDHPVSGFLYLAKPYQNPSGSLIALYLAIHDPITGVVANLPGRVQTDPQTGRITSIFEENPQLPLEDVKVHLFTGPRAALRTPPTCGTYSPTAQVTPWSTPETADATVSDSFAIQATPLGGNCPTEISQLPNSPSFSAGTIAPQAGAYSPFVLKLTRQDDTQEPTKIDATLPPGLIGKLAGISECPEGQIAQALSRSHPNEGALEQAGPSCPSSSEVGTLNVAAGAGITPLHVQGHAYLAGSYKGDPLSLVVITPAVAGPFDLGAVVIRVALHLDPETAQIRAESDPLPAILEGIPLDIRQISLKMGRPDFTLNPTSCDPAAINAVVTSVLAQSAALTSPFQVGGCADLAFKPKLSISLEGQTKRTGHPALTAVATFKAGQANTKRVQVTLPRSEFLDQAHIGTVCTRVQFAADQCPAASVYGKAKAITPLLDKPLEGPVYLRSSSHELPDLVIALEGQVDVVLAGRIDSVNGGIRSTFEATPDAPVTKFTLQMQGGKKGLLINSANLCKLKPAATKAVVKMEGQNGKTHDTEPVVKSACNKAKKHKKGRRGKGHHKRSR
jgi:uncharacterized repeat protein (TIGR01451 family)